MDTLNKILIFLKNLSYTILIVLRIVIVYPFILLFSFISNKIGTEHAYNRTINGRLETPIVFYENPTTKRKFVLILTIHMGIPEYFNNIQKVIDSLDGYDILFEGVGELTEEDKLKFTDTEKEVADQLEFLFTLIDKLRKLMGLQDQREGLSYDSSWINNDIAMYDLIHELAKHDLQNLKINIDFDNIEKDERIKKLYILILRKAMNNLPMILKFISMLSLFSKKYRQSDGAIVDTRNDNAIRIIRKHLKMNNVATIWGAAHYDGLDKYLRNDGFIEVDRKWFAAF